MPNANHKPKGRFFRSVRLYLTDKPKGRFFRSVGLYLTDIVIDIATNGAIFGAKWRKRGLLH